MINESKDAVKAMCASSSLTLGKIALMSKFNCGVLTGDINDIESNFVALYIFLEDYKNLIANYDKIKEKALLFGDTLSVDEYRGHLEGTIDAINDFYRMLPRHDENSKKKQGSATE